MEFVTYTAFTDGMAERPFDPTCWDVFPQDWLDAAPGTNSVLFPKYLRTNPAFCLLWC